jgi:hypothetical protein
MPLLVRGRQHATIVVHDGLGDRRDVQELDRRAGVAREQHYRLRFERPFQRD